MLPYLDTSPDRSLLIDSFMPTAGGWAQPRSECHWQRQAGLSPSNGEARAGRIARGTVQATHIAETSIRRPRCRCTAR